MLTYGDIIKREREKLSNSLNIHWWPLYFYHFTDIQNAINILDEGYIYGRFLAKDKELMKTDNASSSVISVTDKKIHRYVRLYMRPKTPTQYHNEGYKPKEIRHVEIDASCPAPIFFFLDAEKILNLDEVYFAEQGLAGHTIDSVNLLSGVNSFSQLNFDKIFHDGYFDPVLESDIKQYRHTEIIKENAIDVDSTIKGIACRSIAEKQTLLYLLKKLSIEKYFKYRNIISYKPEIDIFYNNGIFIREVNLNNDILTIDLNESYGRYNASKKEVKIEVKIFIDWLDENLQILASSYNRLLVDYSIVSKIKNKLEVSKGSKFAMIEVEFDNNLMYKNEIKLSNYELV